jgi:hydrogenase maturation protease
VDITLILGYGNVDRQDDGVAWHVLAALAKRLGRKTPASYEDDFELTGAPPDLVFALQLTPEFAETIAAYPRVCFVDAHTGSVPNDLNMIEVKGEFQRSPFTHHMTPATCLAMAQALYGGNPEALLVSIRGYEFGFTRSLSPHTSLLAEQAADQIYTWLLGKSKEDMR